LKEKKGACDKPHAQAKLLSPTEKCKICQEQAAKHIHYGAMTCFSCRAFFRRSIQNKTAATYACRRNKTCEINLKTRKNCQYCRYQKCILVGMKPTWVLSDEERERRFRRTRERQHDDRNSLAEEDSLEFPVEAEDPLFNSNIRLKQSCPVDENDHLHRSASLTTAGEDGKIVASEKNVSLIEVEAFKKESLPLAPNETQRSGISQIKVKEETPSSCERGISSSAVHASELKRKDSLESKNVLNPIAVPINVIVQHNTSKIGNNVSQPVNMFGEDLNKTEFLSMKAVGIDNFGSDIVDEEDNDMNEIRKFVDYMNPCYVSAAGNPGPDSSPSTLFYPPDVESNKGAPRETAPTPRLNSPVHQNIVAVDYVETCLDNDETYSSSDDEQMLSFRLYSEPAVKLTVQEDGLLKKLIQEHNDIYRTVSFGEEMIKEMIMCSMFSIPVSTTAAINGYRLCVERVTRIANNLGSYRSLLKEDQVALLMENADLLVSLRGAIFFDPKKKGVDQVLISMGQDDLNIIHSMFSQLLKEDNMKHIDYKTFNSIQAVGTNPMEDRYNLIQEKVGEKLCDEAVIILLSYIILFSSDFCSLVQPLQVQEAQNEYIVLLQRYIYSRYPKHEACLEYAAVFDVFTLIREMAEIKKSRRVNANLIRI